MSRPQIIVNVDTALARRGDPTETGTAFMAFAGATGPTDPVVVASTSDAVAANVPAPIAAFVGDALATGCPSVVIVRADAADVNTVTEAEWAEALDKFHPGFGAGQLLIPGIATPAAHAALVEAAAAQSRVALLDAGEDDAAVAALAAVGTGLTAAENAQSIAPFAPWVQVPVAGGTTRTVPPSVFAAGLAARGDARVGHTNHAPAGTHSDGAGVIRSGVGVTASFTNTELDTLHDAGINVIRMVDGKPTLYAWRSVSDVPALRQFNVGRTIMLLGLGVRVLAEKFLFRQIDGRGHLYAELDGALRGYLAPLWAADALYGATADDAFDVDVASVNDAQTAANGELHASVEVALTQHTEKITINVVTTTPEGA